MKTCALPTPSLTNEWQKLNILIVDDEPMMLEQLESDLAFEDFNLIKAQSAQEGLEILEEQKVHVIVSDQKMPGMCGTEFIRLAKEKQPHVVGMIVSAYNEADYLLNAINQAQVFAYLIKPWDREELIKRLTLALQLCHRQLTEQNKKHEEQLRYTQGMLTEAVQELYKTRSTLKRVKKVMASFISMSSSLSGGISKELADSVFNYEESHPQGINAEQVN